MHVHNFLRVYAASSGVYGAGQNTVTTGEAASGLVLPLVLGIGIFSFLALIVIMLAPIGGRDPRGRAAGGTSLRTAGEHRR